MSDSSSQRTRNVSSTETSHENGNSNIKSSSEKAMRKWCVLTLMNDVEAGDKMKVAWTDGRIFGITCPKPCKKGTDILVVSPDDSPPELPMLPIRSKRLIEKTKANSSLKRKRNTDEQLSQKKKNAIIEVAFWDILWPVLLKTGWTGPDNPAQETIQQQKNRNIKKKVFIPPESYGVRITTPDSGGIPKKGIVTGIQDVIELLKINFKYDSLVEQFTKTVEIKVSQALEEAKKNRRETRHSMRHFTWKYSGMLYPKKESSVGENFQVSFLPTAGSWKTPKEDEKCYELACETNDSLNDIKLGNFKSPIQNQKMNEKNENDWTDKEKKDFFESILSSKKDFSAVSTATGKNKGSCLQYYYAHFKKLKPEYSKLKDLLREHKNRKTHSDRNADFCFECKGMGKLLCCETCENSFHLYCLTPTLTEVPEGDWHCKECVKKGLGAPHLTTGQCSNIPENKAKSNKLSTSSNGTDPKISTDIVKVDNMKLSIGAGAIMGQ